jgi:ribosomal-protein-alanine N-acetyltransferase
MIQIRRFSPTDVATIARIVKESLGESYASSLYLTIHNLWPEGFLVILKDGKVVGFVAAVISGSKTARVLMIAISPSERGMLHGSKLMEDLSANCLSRGLDTITLEVRKSNDRARAFYEKLGFSVVGDIKRFYSNGEDAFRMMKVLQS